MNVTNRQKKTYVWNVNNSLMEKDTKSVMNVISFQKKTYVWTVSSRLMERESIKNVMIVSRIKGRFLF